MKLSELKQIVKEELKRVLKEEEAIQLVSAVQKEEFNKLIKDLKMAATSSEDDSRIGEKFQVYKNLDDRTKIIAIVKVFGTTLAKWPSPLREYARGSLNLADNLDVLKMASSMAQKGEQDPATAAAAREKVQKDTLAGAFTGKLFGDEQAAAVAGTSGPDSLASQGTGGIKCNNAVIIQKASLAALEKLKVKYRIDDNTTNTIKRRISDGKLGNTTLDIMVKLSGGALNPTDYPLNNMQSFQKACKLDQKTITTIVQNINSVSDTVRAALVPRTVAESNYKKMLKKAILEELKKIS